MLLYQILALITHKKIFKKSLKSNKRKISAPIWNEKFELSDGSCSVSDIQDLKYILKQHGKKTDNPSLRI